ncbi:hypothetical protein [Streptomyces lancefieldiae]|uniref:Uncharacterized protein n=1 Tax=Streptomyces lancefieldiae TaxID=3075520 RepID=A0ABU3AW86_9ACTN|nr:hypothetical protein [Streptomyces sp. DSM 40712]MDT0614457.1 hypothetical protein [Streptomyces sp. DSM 40712]
MPDDLYQRYLTALATYLEHRNACTDSTCTDSSRCPEGQRLFTAFTRWQDAYLERQRNTR